MVKFSSKSDKNLDRYQSRYCNDIFRLNCFQDILERRLFPNVKEITESQAGYHAVQEHLMTSLDQMRIGNYIRLIAVGDGVTPRTGALFAFRTKWECISIDPALRVADYRVDRLKVIPERIEDVTVDAGNCWAIIVGIHAHVAIPDILHSINAHRRSLVMMPCCTPMHAPRPADIVYEDRHVHSPKNVVHIWKDI